MEVFNINFCCFITIFAARCYASAALAVIYCVCPSVCPCVCHVRARILSKQINISSFFSPSGSHTIPTLKSGLVWWSCAINWRWSVQWCITVCHGASLFTAQKATHQVNTPKRREHNLIYAAVNLTPEYNRRLRLTFCTIEANYWQTRSIARPLCNSRASCLA